MEKISADSFADKYKPKPKELVSTKQLTIVEVNKVFETIEDLVADGWRAYYCKAIQKLRPPRILELADMARAAKVDDKKKLMSRLTSDALKSL